MDPTAIMQYRFNLEYPCHLPGVADQLPAQNGFRYFGSFSIIFSSRPVSGRSEGTCMCSVWQISVKVGLLVQSFYHKT